MKNLIGNEFTLGELSRVLIEKGMADLFDYDIKRDIFGGEEITVGAVGSMSDNIIKNEFVDNVIFEIVEMAEADTEIIVKVVEVDKI